MQQRSLGTTGLTVSRLGLGLWKWGTETDEHEAEEQLRAYVDAGGTLLDTAHLYGEGASEEMLGSFLDRVVSRADVVVATKAGVAGRRLHDGSRGYLLDSLDLSLRRLGVDHVDLWQHHVWDARTPIEETLSAFDIAVASGRARYVGISNYCGWQTAQAATWQRAGLGRVPLASTQMEYSLLDRSIEAEVVPAARALGLGILPYSPLAGGALTGKYRTGVPSDSRGAHDDGFTASYLGDGQRRVVEAVARAADGLGWTSLEVALTWVRDRPGVTAPIVGARTAQQLTPALSIEDKELPAELVSALDDVSAEGA